MRFILLLIFVSSIIKSSAQSKDDDFMIPYLCANGKYKLVNKAGEALSQCVFEDLTFSEIGVALGVKDGNVHFVSKEGKVSFSIPNIQLSNSAKIFRYKRLRNTDRFYSLTQNDLLYIYDRILNRWHGPLKENIERDINHLSFYGDPMLNTAPLVIYSKKDKLLVLNQLGAYKVFNNNSPDAYKLLGQFLYYFGDQDKAASVYDLNFNEVMQADTFIFKNNWTNAHPTAIKDGKRYLIETKNIYRSTDQLMQTSLDIREIAFSYQWESAGYSYFEEGSRKWIEDKEGNLFYTLTDGEQVLPYLDNIISYRGNDKRMLIGDSSSVFCQPHLSLSTVESRVIVENEDGFHILQRSGRKYLDEIFANASRVDKEMFWVEYKDGRRELLDKNLSVRLQTKDKIVKTFIGNTYVYEADSLYGLLDSVGNRITPALSTQSDFYFDSVLEWIKIDRGSKAYLYNIFTQNRTVGLSNEFRMSDRHFDEKGRNLITSYTYGLDSTYFYRQDGSLYQALGRSQSQFYQKEKHRYTRKEVTRNNYVYIDQLYSDTLLTCNNCDGMYLIYPLQDQGVEYVICSYRNLYKDLYDKRGNRLLPEGMSMLRSASMKNELSYYPEIIVQQNGKIGIYNIENEKPVIPLVYDDINRLGRDRLGLRSKGKDQITDLSGTPLNGEQYYRTRLLSNGDIAAQFPIEGTHKKKVYRDPNDPDMDPCEGKIVDAPNYYYKIIDEDGRSRFNRKFIDYRYKRDDLISVSEWIDNDTIHYCMDIKGERRKVAKDAIIFEPYYDDIILAKDGAMSTFLDLNLAPLVNKKFRDVGRLELQDSSVFYIGWDSTYTYVYNEKFEEKTKVQGRYFITRYGSSMMYLYHHDHLDIVLLNIDGSLFLEDIVQRAEGLFSFGINAYRKDGKRVFVDMINGKKFWDEI